MIHKMTIKILDYKNEIKDIVILSEENGDYVSKYIIQPAKVKEHYIDVPYRDGKLDLTEVLTGKPTFEDKDGEIELYTSNSNTIAALTSKVNGSRCIVQYQGREDIGRLSIELGDIKGNLTNIKIKGRFE